MTLPLDLQALFDRGLGAPRRSPDELRDQVNRQLAAAVHAHASDPLVDLDLARQLADACGALLELWGSLSDTHRAHVQVACLWFSKMVRPIPGLSKQQAGFRRQDPQPRS